MKKKKPQKGESKMTLNKWEKKDSKRQSVVALSGETLLLLSDEKSICYRAIINYVPQPMVEGARGFGVHSMCVLSRNRPPIQLVRQLAKEKE